MRAAVTAAQSHSHPLGRCAIRGVKNRCSTRAPRLTRQQPVGIEDLGLNCANDRVEFRRVESDVAYFRGTP